MPKLLLILLYPLSCIVCFAEELTSLLPLKLASHLNVKEVHEYECPRNMQCQVRCSSGPGFDGFNYENVSYFEWGKGDTHWAMSATYIDAIGKSHLVTGMLPGPVACILDDLELISALPLVDGKLVRPTDDAADVIFDIQPSN